MSGFPMKSVLMFRIKGGMKKGGSLISQFTATNQIKFIIIINFKFQTFAQIWRIVKIKGTPHSAMRTFL